MDSALPTAATDQSADGADQVHQLGRARKVGSLTQQGPGFSCSSRTGLALGDGQPGRRRVRRRARRTGRDPPVAGLGVRQHRGQQWFHWTAARAAREIAVLGPAGRPLTARLEALLDDPAQAPSAVLGLLAVADPAGLDRARLAALANGDRRIVLDLLPDRTRRATRSLTLPSAPTRAGAASVGTARAWSAPGSAGDPPSL